MINRASRMPLPTGISSSETPCTTVVSAAIRSSRPGPRRLGHDLVEPLVLPPEDLLAAGTVPHEVDGLLQQHELFVGDVFGGEARHHGFEGLAGEHDVGQRGGVELKQEGEAAGEVLRLGPADDRAALGAGADVDDALGFEQPQRFPERHPADAEHLEHLLLPREAGTLGEVGVDDVGGDVAGDPFRRLQVAPPSAAEERLRARRERGVERHRGSPSSRSATTLRRISLVPPWMV